MNIIGHTIIGISGYIITNDIIFLFGSIIPDISLILNEIRFKKFNKWDVRFKKIYDIFHSIYMPIIFIFFNYNLFFAWLIHILIDIPFHSSSFRWKPFLINRYDTQKKALLLSGGMDSIVCGLIEKDYDIIFFDYNQSYLDEEYRCAKLFADRIKKEIKIIKQNWHTDIQNRNYYMIAEVKKMGYDEVIIGTRNIIPLFDKYKDSNWFNLKLYQYLIKIYINMPIIGNFKWQVKRKLDNYCEYYSTEK